MTLHVHDSSSSLNISGFPFVTAKVAFITAMISKTNKNLNLMFHSRSSIVYVFDTLFLHHIIDRFTYILTKNDQLSVGSIAQLVEHFTGITEVMGSNPVQGFLFVTAKVAFITAMISKTLYLFHFHSLSVCL